MAGLYLVDGEYLFAKEKDAKRFAAWREIVSGWAGHMNTLVTIKRVMINTDTKMLDKDKSFQSWLADNPKAAEELERIENQQKITKGLKP